MGLMKKSNGVSWATGPNLCQVKHFLQEDCPSKVGRGSQLLLKRSHPSIIRPSFEGRHCLNQSKERLPHISLAKWERPPKFNLNEKWRVVVGEESKEAEDQEYREKRVLEAVYPSRSAIPPNPSTSSELDQYYDDSHTQVIPIIPIEEAADVEVSSSSHLTPSQNISSKLPDASLPNSPSSSVSMVTSEKLPANGKSYPPPLSTSQNPRKPPSNSPFCVRLPANVLSAPPYPSRCQNLKGSEQTQVSPKPLVNYNSVPQYPSTCKNLSTPDQTEFSPGLPANQNHAPKYRAVCENQNISQLKSQVSGMPPANHNPVTQVPSTCENPSIPRHQAEVLPKSLSNYNPATQYHSTYENPAVAQCSNQNSPKLPANGICMSQYQRNGENLGVSEHKNQVCSYPPANEKSILKLSHGFEGDLMVSVAAAVTALAKSQEQGSLIDTNFLVKLLSNPEQIQKLMNEHGVATNSKTGAASGLKPLVPFSTTPRSTADSLDKHIAGNENCNCVVADSTVFSLSLEVRNTNEQRGTAAMSRPVDLLVPLPRTKPKVINKPINEYQAPNAGSGPIFGPKPMAITKPETSVKSNLANEQGAPPHVGTADIRSKPLVHPTSDLNLEKIKKLINEYGAPGNVGGKPLVNSELVPKSFPKFDVVSSRVDHPTALQPELQIKSHSPNTGHTSPFSSMTSPAPLHKDINYYKSLIKQHGVNRESVDQLLQNSNPRGNSWGPELLKKLKPNQRSLNFQKHCVFFDTPKGCLNGSSCPYLHDKSRQRRSGGMLEATGSKRTKLGRELTSRT